MPMQGCNETELIDTKRCRRTLFDARQTLRHFLSSERIEVTAGEVRLERAE